MTRATFTIAAIAFLSSAAAAPSPPVTFESPCSCRDNHGEHRWAVKNDPSTPPVDTSAIQAVTPSGVFGWPGPAEHLNPPGDETNSPVIRVYDESGNVIETHEHKGDFKEP
jgi:hypothetical protein